MTCHPLWRLKKYADDESKLIEPLRKLDDVFCKVGQCWATNVQESLATTFRLSVHQEQEGNRILEKLVSSISSTPHLTYPQECVLCNNIYITERDWAGREQLVITNPPNPSLGTPITNPVPSQTQAVPPPQDHTSRQVTHLLFQNRCIYPKLDCLINSEATNIGHPNLDCTGKVHLS